MKRFKEEGFKKYGGEFERTTCAFNPEAIYLTEHFDSIIKI